MPSIPTVSAPAPGAAARERGRDELSRRLRRLERVFRIESIRAEPLTAAQVVDYYEQCHDAYRKYHSSEGAVHMALNDGGRFDPAGFTGQLRRIEQGWAQPPADVLELAFGQGYNLAWLASRHPRTQFTGIDLTPAHQQIAGDRIRREGLANVTLTAGDFHKLPYADASFDQVFCIEAFCYATDLAQAFAEVARVLRPGGVFTLFDGYLPRPPAELSRDEALAVDLVAKGMAIDALQVIEPFLRDAAQAGLRTDAVDALDDAVMPSLLKLERITAAIVRFPWLGRRMLSRRPPMRGRNVLAGYLMRTTVAMGLIGYRHVTLRKAD